MMIWGRKDIKEKVIKMKNNEIKERFRNPRGKGTVLNEAWRRLRKDRGIIDKKRGFDVFKEEYEVLTCEIFIEMDKGERRKKELINDYEMIQELMESRNITWENTGIMYTDGSKKKNKGKATGAAFIFEEEDEGYYLSLNKRSSIFIAEVVVIAKWLQNYEKKKIKKRIF